MTKDENLRNSIRDLVRQALTSSPASYFAPWTGVQYDAHPSRQPFNIAEATAASTDNLIEFIESKLCSIEKNKACDQCGMCRTLGF